MQNNRLLHEQKAELFSLWESSKYSIKELSIKFGVSYNSIYEMLKRNGYKTPTRSESKRLYPVDETFFDEIDTEQKAYFLGILYADGWNSPERNTVNLALKKDDKDLLLKLNGLLQPSKPLQLVKIESKCFKKVTPKVKDQYRIVISSKRISERLSEYGCVKAKTHILKFPEWINTNLVKHFIRGYFDGDGSISDGRESMINIVGNNLFLESLQNILINTLGFKKTKLHSDDRSSCNIKSIQIGGIKNCIKFCDWIYGDASIYLERKRIIYEKYKNNLNVFH